MLETVEGFWYFAAMKLVFTFLLLFCVGSLSLERFDFFEAAQTHGFVADMECEPLAADFSDCQGSCEEEEEEEEEEPVLEAHSDNNNPKRFRKYVRRSFVAGTKTFLDSIYWPPEQA